MLCRPFRPYLIALVVTRDDALRACHWLSYSAPLALQLLLQRLRKVRDQIVLVFNANRDSHEAVTDAGGAPLVGRMLVAPHRCRMHDQSVHAAQTHRARRELQSVDEPRSRMLIAFQFDTH